MVAVARPSTAADVESAIVRPDQSTFQSYAQIFAGAIGFTRRDPDKPVCNNIIGECFMDISKGREEQIARQALDVRKAVTLMQLQSLVVEKFPAIDATAVRKSLDDLTKREILWLRSSSNNMAETEKVSNPAENKVWYEKGMDWPKEWK
jgi:hypothetical protein